MRYATYISALLLGLAVLGAWLWLQETEEDTVLNIMAAREPELGLPVYAQFVVTQSLQIPEGAQVQRLVVPVYWPSREHGLVIDLLQEERQIWRWRVTEHEEGLAELNLPLLHSRIQGQVEVRFASDATHETQANAPRLLVESADEQYPDGNYRIAENVKQGDVSLRVAGVRTKADKIKESWEKRPLRLVGDIGQLTAGVLLLLAVPGVVGNLVWPRRSK